MTSSIAASRAAATGEWTTVADLPEAVSWSGQHDGAIVLDDAGTVLVAGGANAASAALDLSAVFDPGTGEWTRTGGLKAPRRLHTLTRLDDGRVLATGGLSGSSSAAPGLATVELYDPEDQTWSPTGALTTPRYGHSAALLPDGTVLVAGGTTLRDGRSTKALRTAERYDPETGEWSEAAEMTDARTGHTALTLAGGVVLVCGGTAPVGTADDPALAFCELYDPDDDRWNPTGSLSRGRQHHQATRLSDTTVLITGGTAPGASGAGPFDPFSQRTAERFDLSSGSWSPAANMPSGRAFHRAVLVSGGRVLVVGGAASERDESGYRSAIVYDPAKDAWKPVAGLATGRWALAAAILPSSGVLVAGGVVRSGLAAADPAVVELTASTERFA